MTSRASTTAPRSTRSTWKNSVAMRPKSRLSTAPTEGPPPGPGLMVISPWVSRMRSASRSEARLTPKRSSIPASLSSASPGRRPCSTMSRTISRATRDATFSPRGSCVEGAALVVGESEATARAYPAFRSRIRTDMMVIMNSSSEGGAGPGIGDSVAGRALRARAQGRHTDKLGEALAALDPDLLEYADGFIFGAVWTGPDLAFEDRMLVALTALAATGQTAQLGNYLHGALQDGMPPARIKEALKMLIVYVGFPTAIT